MSAADERMNDAGMMRPASLTDGDDAAGMQGDELPGEDDAQTMHAAVAKRRLMYRVTLICQHTVSFRMEFKPRYDELLWCARCREVRAIDGKGEIVS
jgi:hypothetical protein